MAPYDQKLTDEIKERFQADTRIYPKNITVEVSNGRVQLSGSVVSLTSYNAAESIVWTLQGVTALNNRLSVIFPENMKRPSDEVLIDSLKRLFSWDPDLYLENIDLSIDDTSIIISGSVDAYYKKLRANDLIRQSTSIFLIRNELSVVPTHKSSDQVIARSITSSIDKFGLGNINTIMVEVQNGKVFLNGTVPGKISFDSVEDIARYTNGVTGIENRLVITA